jgi:DNA-directed RNA polymerase subunit RPC12/RpoP
LVIVYKCKSCGEPLILQFIKKDRTVFECLGCKRVVKEFKTATVIRI